MSLGVTDLLSLSPSPSSTQPLPIPSLNSFFLFRNSGRRCEAQGKNFEDDQNQLNSSLNLWFVKRKQNAWYKMYWNPVDYRVTTKIFSCVGELASKMYLRNFCELVKSLIFLQNERQFDKTLSHSIVWKTNIVIHFHFFHTLFPYKEEFVICSLNLNP